MSELVDRIEQAIKEKGSNFKRVERECGLGNGTIKRLSLIHISEPTRRS